MPARKKPTPPKKKPSALDKIIEDAVKNAKARKRSGQTDQEWREGYAASLKTAGASVPLSQTPFDGDTIKKKH
jgi:hypothetical protein